MFNVAINSPSCCTASIKGLCNRLKPSIDKPKRLHSPDDKRIIDKYKPIELPAILEGLRSYFGSHLHVNFYTQSVLIYGFYTIEGLYILDVTTDCLQV